MPWSVVIPTYQRRDVVVAAVRALADQDVDEPFEVVVVVDGSRDGTAPALRALDVPFGLTVLEQGNAGAAQARNRGAGAATGTHLLFLDDDMVAAPDLLRRHAAAHARGADAVVGHIPVHPDAPRTFLTRGLEQWAQQRRDRLAGGAPLTFADLLTGQLSVGSGLFHELGGFDEGFTRGGSFGREDTDFGWRLFQGGHRVVFDADAVSRQYYVVAPEAYLRQWHQAGQADVAYLRKHPEQQAAVYASRRPHTPWNRLLRPVARVPVLPDLLAPVARAGALALVRSRPDAAASGRWFKRVRDLEYWRGVERAGGFPADRPARVLCYHSLQDLTGAPVIEQYGVPADDLRRQLRLLRRAGFRFVSLGELLRYLDGEAGLPRRALLVTFDDCFRDLLTEGLPVLTDERVPSAAFAVSGLLGGSNIWDVRLGAPELALLDADGLAALAAAGVEIGAHGATHRPVADLAPHELSEEVEGARGDLAAVGLAVDTFAYPHGAHDGPARRAVARSGYTAAFTVRPGLVRRGRVDPYALPRVEVLRRDGSGLRLLAKVVAARPARRQRHVLRRGAGLLRRRVRRLLA